MGSNQASRFRLLGAVLSLLLSLSLSVVFAGEPFQEAKQDSLRKLIRFWGQKAAENHNDPGIMNKLAELYFYSGKLDSAESWLNLSEQLDNRNPNTYFWRGRIFLKKGKFGLIPLEKLLALLKQDNRSKAIKNFSRAIALKPDFLEAYYYLGEAHVAKGGNSHFRKAVDAYQFILNRENDYLDTRYRLGIAYHKLKQYPSAVACFNTYFDLHPEDSRPFIELSRVYLEMGKPKEASHYFLSGVVKLRDKKMLEDLFLEIRDIANEDEKKEFENTPLERKGYFFQKFWKSRDPTPFTEENERFTEHFRRVQLARQLYPTVIPPYYDHRGRVYVKYGPPDDRYVSSMTATGARDNESWSYEKSIQEGLVFDFINLGGVYKLVQDLTEAAPPGLSYDSRLQLAAQLYNDRAVHLGGSYNIFSLQFKENYLIDFTNKKIDAQQSAPPEVFHYDYHAKPLPFQLSYAQFRGTRTKTKLEVYHSVASKYLTFNQFFNQIASSLRVSILIYDSLYNEIEKRSYNSNFILASRKEIPYTANINQTTFYLPPLQRYHLVVKIENPEGKKLGMERWQIDLRRFPSDSLAVSDIELASKIEPTSKRDQFFKHGLKVLPYTFPRYSLKVPLKIYYEIYNLAQDSEGKTKYEVNYQLTSLERKETGVKKLFRSIGKLFGAGGNPSVTSSYLREGNSPNEREFISINIKKMPAGFSRLAIIIRDLIANQTQTSTLQLKLVKTGD